MFRQRRVLPWLTLVSAVVLWGVSFVLTKQLLSQLSPPMIAWLRLGPALAVLVPLMLWQKESWRLEKGFRGRFVLTSALGIVLYMVLENTGLRYTQASTASMLVASIPVFVLLVDTVKRRARLPWGQTGAVLVSLVGVWLVLFDGAWPNLASANLGGNLLVLGAMASWIGYTFLGKKLRDRFSSLQQTTFQTLFAVLLYLPFVIGEGGGFPTMTLTGLAELSFLGVFCSGLAYVGFLYALKELGPVLPSAFLNLIPVVTVLTALLVLKEIPSIFQAGGMVLIVGSLSWLTLKR